MTLILLNVTYPRRAYGPHNLDHTISMCYFNPLVNWLWCCNVSKRHRVKPVGCVYFAYLTNCRMTSACGSFPLKSRFAEFKRTIKRVINCCSPSNLHNLWQTRTCKAQVKLDSTGLTIYGGDKNGPILNRILVKMDYNDNRTFL